MAFKPHRPIRLGTSMTMTDAHGKVPKAGGQPAAPRQAPVLPDLAPMAKAQLIATAKAEGVTVESDDNKADLIDKIEKARG